MPGNCSYSPPAASQKSRCAARRPSAWKCNSETPSTAQLRPRNARKRPHRRQRRKATRVPSASGAHQARVPAVKRNTSICSNMSSKTCRKAARPRTAWKGSAKRTSSARCRELSRLAIETFQQRDVASAGRSSPQHAPPERQRQAFGEVREQTHAEAHRAREADARVAALGRWWMSAAARSALTRNGMGNRSGRERSSERARLDQGQGMPMLSSSGRSDCHKRTKAALLAL